MSRVHYSTIAQYGNCPHAFKLRYKDEIETIFNCDPQNALVIGTALHRGVEIDAPTAIKEYYASYPVIKDAHVTEAMKLEYLIPIVKSMIPEGEHEVNFKTDDYEGTIDLLAPIELTSEEMDDICGECEKYDTCGSCTSGRCPCGKYDQYYDLYDFKYSNNVDNYMKSPQMHLYKYFWEQANPGKKIRNLFFVFVPKTFLRLKYKNKTNPRDETIYEYRNRCMEDLKKKQVQVLPVKYDQNKVVEFMRQYARCLKDTEFSKNPTRLCDWCDYKSYCEKGIDYMLLPKNERRAIALNTTPDMWLYADSYVGKSTFVDKLDNLLFINTDGNTENITSPVMSVANEIVHEGRMTKKIFAWEKFLEIVEELEKGENDFKVVALDLLEDLYEHCRLYMYDKLKIEHETDAGFGKGWDMVRTEFLTTIKRLKHLGYRIIYISKELKTEINLKSGQKLTSFAPNLPDKVANVLAGTVTMTLRAYMDNRGRFLQLTKQENVFGGGRYNFVNDKCPLDMDAFVKELTLAQGDAKPAAEKTTRRSKPAENAPAEEKTEEPAETEEPAAEAPAEEPKKKRKETAEPKRKKREEPREESIEEFVGQDPIEEREAPAEPQVEAQAETADEEPPRRRRRKA